MHIVAGLEIARRADQIGEALQLFPREALYEVSLHRRSISAPEQGRVFNPKPQLAILVVAPLQHSGKKHMPVAKELGMSRSLLKSEQRASLVERLCCPRGIGKIRAG